MADRSTPLRLRDDVVVTVLPDGALLLDLDTKFFYVANPSAWAVIQLFEEGTTLAAAVEQCRGAGAPDADVVAVEALHDTLVAEGLVEPGTADTQPRLALEEPWTVPTLERQAEPLQRVIVNAFDPSVPLAE